MPRKLKIANAPVSVVKPASVIEEKKPTTPGPEAPSDNTASQDSLGNLRPLTTETRTSESTTISESSGPGENHKVGKPPEKKACVTKKKKVRTKNGFAWMLASKHIRSSISDLISLLVISITFLLFAIVTAIFLLRANPLLVDLRSIMSIIISSFIALIITILIKPKDSDIQRVKDLNRDFEKNRVSIHFNDVFSIIRVTVFGRVAVFFLLFVSINIAFFFAISQIDGISARQHQRDVTPIQREVDKVISDLESFSQHRDFRPLLKGWQPSEKALLQARAEADKRKFASIVTQTNALRQRVEKIDDAPIALVDKLYYASGLAYFLLRESKVAEEHLRMVTHADDSIWVKAQTMLAREQMSQGKMADCKVALDSLLKGYPTSSNIRFLLGLYHFRQREFKEAAEAFLFSRGLETTHFVFGDPRIQEDCAIVSAAFCYKLLNDDFEIAPLSNLKTQVLSAIERGRIRSETLTNYRNCWFLVDSISTFQFVYDELPDMKDYIFIKSKCTEIDELHGKDRVFVSLDFLTCIKESMQLISQSQKLYDKYGSHESELISIFETVRSHTPESIYSLECEVDVRNSMSNIICNKITSSPKSALVDLLMTQLEKAEEKNDEVAKLVDQNGGKYRALLSLGYRGIRKRAIGKACNKPELIAAGNELLQNVVDSDEADHVFPSDSPYIPLFKNILKRSK